MPTIIKPLFLLAFTLILLVLAGLGVWRFLSNAERFPVNHVKVEAQLQHLSQQAVRDVVLPNLEAGFFAVDSKSIKKQLLAMPWIAEASVSRIWPDTLLVSLKEQQAVARWGQNGLLNAKGEVFGHQAWQVFDELPQLLGPSDQAKHVLQNYQSMRTIVVPLGMTIQILQLTERGSWQMQLSNGLVVVVGRADLEKRLQRFVATYDKLVAASSANIERIDLRYSHGVAVRESITNI